MYERMLNFELFIMRRKSTRKSLLIINIPVATAVGYNIELYVKNTMRI